MTKAIESHPPRRIYRVSFEFRGPFGSGELTEPANLRLLQEILTAALVADGYEIRDVKAREVAKSPGRRLTNTPGRRRV